jgi:hypothetical protein
MNYLKQLINLITTGRKNKQGVDGSLAGKYLKPVFIYQKK